MAQKHHVSIDRIRLLFSGMHMSDDQRQLASYGVSDGGTVHMVVQDQVTINITVDLPDGTSRTISVEPSGQISMLKRKLHESFGYEILYMELFYEGRQISEGRLSYHHIVDGAKLQLRLKKISIMVRKMDGKTISMEVSHVETVDQLKARLHRETGVVANQQQLQFNGKVLTSGRLAQYGVQTGSVINMVGRLRGG